MVFLVGIAVAAIDHQLRIDASISQVVLSLIYCSMVEVGPILASPQYDVTV